MKRAVLKMIAVLAFGASITISGSAIAEEWPFVPGDYWEVTGIDLADGGAFKYATWLATEWKKDLEFAKSKGWIKNYMVLSNEHARSDEPDLYLVTVFDNLTDSEESQKRQKEYMEWQSKSIEKMQAESGNRAEYRTVMSSSLLRVLKFRD